MNANRFSALAFFALLLPCVGQQNLDTAFRTTGNTVLAAFDSERQVLQTSSAVILNGRDEIGYGVVISAEGHILTKASEVLDAAALAVTVDQTKYTGAKVLMVDPAWDVALLKVEASGLLPVSYAESSELPQGTWVVANGASSRSGRRQLAGIISAKTREIPASGGIALGVVLKDKKQVVEIESVNEKSGAKEAGLQGGDVILAIEDEPMKKIEDMSKVLKDRKAGSTVKVKYRRGESETTVEVRLAAKAELFQQEPDRNDQMSGQFSPRRSGFPRVLQHTVISNRFTQGGPLLDLEGRCVGMNIARANRAESFAIPVEELKEIAARLMKQSAKIGN